MPFDPEPIPDEDQLFHRVHRKGNVDRQGKLIAHCFRQQGTGSSRSLSCDWEKYSTAEKTRDRANEPAENAVVQFFAGPLREKDFSVEHTPLDENRAHTDVKFDESSRQAKTKSRAILASLATTAIPFSE